MVEPAALMLLNVGEVAQRVTDTSLNFRGGPPFAPIADRKRGEPKTRRCQAGHLPAAPRRLVSAVPRAIECQAGAGIRLLPEVQKGAARKVLDEIFIGPRQRKAAHGRPGGTGGERQK